MSAIPLEVLGDALATARRGRVVKAAVFTTFTFDPGFFELHVLPLLFDRMSQLEKVKRLQLEHLLLNVDVAVYYDRTGLSQDALPSHGNFRRIDVRRQGTGLFHPKLIMMLVEDPQNPDDPNFADGPPLSLIVGALSANLTRAGWWENVETGHFEEIKDVNVDSSRVPYRRDLLSIIRRLRDLAPDDDHVALDRIHEFLREETNRNPRSLNKYGGRYYTRLFVGQTSLPDWLFENGVGGEAWNLEVISPYFDTGHAGTLKALIDATGGPKEVRVFLPTAADGTAAVDEHLYEAVAAHAQWSALPDHITRPAGRAASEAVPPRRVHAKVYRFWRSDGLEVVLTGSPNLTSPAHSHAAAGNLEAAFLVDRGGEGRRTWWLQPIEREPSAFFETAESEADDAQAVFVDVSFRYDWGGGELSYRIEGETIETMHVSELGGKPLFTVERPVLGSWQSCGAGASSAVRSLLTSSSFLEIRTDSGTWRVLVREEGMVHRPSLISELTPEEILLYWSLLSEEQKEAFLEAKLAAEAQLEGISPTALSRLIAQDTIFDRFAGVYHAFGRLQERVERAIERGDEREAEARLFGAQYDSLPVLLQRLLDRDAESQDAVLTYTTFLCALQLQNEVKQRRRDFWHRHAGVRKKLEDLVNQIRSVEWAVLPNDPERQKFLEWYGRMFLKRIALPEQDA